ncbi:6-phosphofructokinase [Rubidibacter lacunae KORDI 51-2]|uniref:ATP-dependent 6-phosphofructokinase n=1 Tax=Rubidibacter lacunae KORDI 51-2 TaxID=582515 RepID=U5DFU5_9CHRO|nr:ATP-dependent 6-phosphofructokinase [Rubidibacter lacunae]ERN40122.1 6-phosphofructokinase [Rubidibacter lacunae KORDI 51-2]
MTRQKRVGILTSGGDCGGLNAVTRAVVRRARDYGFAIYGIKDATMGLLSRPVEAELLDTKRVSSILRYGGTILGTINKNNPFAFPMPDGSLVDRSEEAIEGYHRLGLDALIGIGGDGSLAILDKLARQGNWNLVGVPKTIDNDVGTTEHSIGFHTALSIAVEALDRLTYTAISHSRVMVLEVMGRDAGHIAIGAGIAGGAHVILIPELPYSLEKVCEKILERKEQGNNYSIVVVAEAVKTESGEPVRYTNSLGQTLYGGIGHYIGNEISKRTGIETRVSILGHLQRGGTPSALDRLFGAAFGVAALDLVAQNKFGRMVAWQNRRVVDVPIAEAIAQYRSVELDGALVETALGLNTYIGEVDRPHPPYPQSSVDLGLPVPHGGG